MSTTCQILARFWAFSISKGNKLRHFYTKKGVKHRIFFTNLSINCVLDRFQVIHVKNQITNWKCVNIQHHYNHFTPVSFIHEHMFMWECEEKSKKAFFYWNKKWASTNCSVKYTHFPRTLFFRKINDDIKCLLFCWLWGLSGI